MKCWRCKVEVSLPQWCYTHQKPHQDVSELTHECRITGECNRCALWLHDVCGMDPGFVHDYAKDPLEP